MKHLISKCVTRVVNGNKSEVKTPKVLHQSVGCLKVHQPSDLRSCGIFWHGKNAPKLKNKQNIDHLKVEVHPIFLFFGSICGKATEITSFQRVYCPEGTRSTQRLLQKIVRCQGFNHIVALDSSPRVMTQVTLHFETRQSQIKFEILSVFKTWISDIPTARLQS